MKYSRKRDCATIECEIDDLNKRLDKLNDLCGNYEDEEKNKITLYDIAQANKTLLALNKELKQSF